VDIYDNGNFFEAEVKNYRDASKDKKKDCLWANIFYLNDKNTKARIDLSTVKTVELPSEDIIALEDGNFHSEEMGYLGRRLTVQWSNGARYTGMVTKTMKSKKTFVFIQYEDGDCCWYSLIPEKEKKSLNDSPRGIDSNSASTIKKESSGKEQRMKNGTENSDGRHKKEKKDSDVVLKDLEKEFPIGSFLAVDLNNNDTFYECQVKKHSKKSKDNNKLWLYVHEKNRKSSKWINLNVFSFFKLKSEKINDLDNNEGEDAGFLSKRIRVEWSDGRKYDGLVTKTMNIDSNLVFIEFEDSDKCWIDLQRDESRWCVLDDSKDDSGYDSLGDKAKANALPDNKSKRKKNKLTKDSKKKQKQS